MKVFGLGFLVFLSSSFAFAVKFPLWSAKSDSASWNQTIRNSLLGENKDLLDSSPADATSFCSNFRNLGQEDRLKFWTQLIAALAEKESDFNPNVTYTEQFSDSTGRRVVSRGLLQLSYESARSYGCRIDNSLALRNSTVNLQCGLRIMKRWVLNDGRIQGGGANAWRGLSRYWGPFRSSKLTAQMRANIQGISVCQN